MQARSLQLLAFAAVLAFAVPGPAAAMNGEEDPCRTREPTLLDRLPEWRCIGLATFGDDISVARDGRHSGPGRDDFPLLGRVRRPQARADGRPSPQRRLELEPREKDHPVHADPAVHLD
jgi:hypothetical protein